MGMNLLVIDDSAIVRKVMKKTISLSNVEVDETFEAADGLLGIEQLKTNKVDLIFLDINMPNMNGIEFLEHIRQVDEFQQIPVVVISTEGSNDRIQKLEELGITAFLRKPVTAEQIAELVNSLMEAK